MKGLTREVVEATSMLREAKPCNILRGDVS